MPIPIGTTVKDGGLYVPEYRWISDTSSGDTGSSSQAYSSEDVGTAKLEENTPRKTGPMVKDYEPEIAALFAGNV